MARPKPTGTFSHFTLPANAEMPSLSPAKRGASGVGNFSWLVAVFRHSFNSPLIWLIATGVAIVHVKCKHRTKTTPLAYNVMQACIYKRACRCVKCMRFAPIINEPQSLLHAAMQKRWHALKHAFGTLAHKKEETRKQHTTSRGYVCQL